MKTLWNFPANFRNLRETVWKFRENLQKNLEEILETFEALLQMY